MLESSGSLGVVPRRGAASKMNHATILPKFLPLLATNAPLFESAA